MRDASRRCRIQADSVARVGDAADTRGSTPAARRLSLNCASVAAATLVFALAACAPPAATPAPAPTPAASAGLPAGVEVELFQLRSDVAERGAQVRVVNGSDTDMVVTKVTFEDDWFTGESVRERTSTIAAGRTIDLRIALPESACDDVPDAADRTSRVTLELESGASATVEVADPLGFTALIHERECLRNDLAQVMTLEWAAFTPSAAPQPAELGLAITPAGGAGSAQLIDVQTTNLLGFAGAPSAFPLALQVAGTDAATTVAVPIVPLRCDPHAVMEDKRGTVFDVAVEAGGTAGVVEVAASETMRGEILRWVADWCGFGPG
jgi:hypothetical protein